MTSYLGEIARYTLDQGTATNHVTVPYTASVAAGRFVVLAVNAPAGSTGVTYNATDTKGNTWHFAVVEDAAVANNRLGVLWAIISTAVTTSDTITLNVSSGVRQTWLVVGQAFDNPTGIDVYTTSQGTTSSPTTGTTAAAAQNAQLLFWCSGWSGAPTMSSGPAGFTLGNAVTTTTLARNLQTGWSIVNSNGSSGRTAGNAALSGTTTWDTILVAFNTPAPVALAASGTSTFLIDATASTGVGSFSIAQTSGPTGVPEAVASGKWLVPGPSNAGNAVYTVSSATVGDGTTPVAVTVPAASSSANMTGVVQLAWNGTDWA